MNVYIVYTIPLKKRITLIYSYLIKVISKDDSLIKIHLNNLLPFRYNYQATYRSHLPTSAQTPSPPKLPPKISAQQSNYPVIPPKIPLSADVPKLPPKIKISSGPTVDGN